VFGNYSGRNAGDNALLEGLMHDISSIHPQVEFHIPTINPRFVARTYKRYAVTPVSMLPWNGSVKIMGWPALRAALRADVILVTDAILFDRHFWNPLHNYLHTLSYLLPLASSRGIPVVAYNAHLGPLMTEAGRRAMQRLLRSCTMLILRDEDSLALLIELGEQRSDVILGADCALNVKPCSTARICENAGLARILEGDEPLLTVTLSAYLGTVPGKETVNRSKFVETMSRTLDILVERLNVNIILIASQHMDVSINRDVLNLMVHRSRAEMISNRQYTHNELACVLQQSELQISMRTHPMIFASAMEVPVMSIDANPKNVSFLRSIGQGNRRLSIHEDILEGLAAEKIIDTWRERKAIKRKLAQIMPAEREKARRAAFHLTDLLVAVPGATAGAV